MADTNNQRELNSEDLRFAGDAGGQLTDTRGAAKHVGFKVGTFANWRCLGKGPRYIKAGGRVLYRLSDLDAWLTRHSKDPEAAR
jgi:hypothetical protein